MLAPLLFKIELEYIWEKLFHQISMGDKVPEALFAYPHLNINLAYIPLLSNTSKSSGFS